MFDNKPHGPGFSEASRTQKIIALIVLLGTFPLIFFIVDHPEHWSWVGPLIFGVYGLLLGYSIGYSFGFIAGREKAGQEYSKYIEFVPVKKRPRSK